MKTPLFPAALAAAAVFPVFPANSQENAAAPAPLAVIERKLPPPGIEIPAETRERVAARLEKLSDDLWGAGPSDYADDAAVYLKAVGYALEHGEIYSEKELPLLDSLLDKAAARVAALDAGSHPWSDRRGLLALGYTSSIDGSVQPYGLEIPEKLDLSKPVPLLVWLHGRGDKTTDLTFVSRCEAKSQALGGKVGEQRDAIIVHPFGRHCIGWKHAGEIDVLEVIEQVKKRYPIDPDRVALAGFSMGGAGAWHIGAHHADRFCAVHTGAGFVETAIYNKLTPETYPPGHEQTLWGLYDVPGYVRNFFNVPLLAYSGENDRQREAAELMADTIAKAGGELRHVIGPGMEHRYHDEKVKEIWAWLLEQWKTGRDTAPPAVHVQTRTLRYPGLKWAHAEGLEKHWSDSRVEARWDFSKNRIALETENVTALRLDAPAGKNLAGAAVAIGGSELTIDDPGFPVASAHLRRTEKGWIWGEPEGLRKRPGLQGPIDDAFMAPFVVVGPAKAGVHPRVQRWVEFELEHLRRRWSSLMRGKLPMKDVAEVNSVDIDESNLILWGDPQSNPLIAEIADRLPVEWTPTELRLGGKSYPAESHAPVLVFPNPLNPKRYVVINSGLTFREGHDRTNSLQNPKLPDWAVIDLTVPPDDLAPGKVVAADFFDENWRIAGER
ncbi:MAG: prolyl oligopeptidase family serine peptidase [Akkermansiaceae bacterium]|nr:prolyl oligopeptidase family serine peptidase [Akkermansiaceae bacterium]